MKWIHVNKEHLPKCVLYILVAVKVDIWAKRVVTTSSVDTDVTTSANNEFQTVIGSRKTRTDTGFAATARQSSGIVTSPTLCQIRSRSE